MEPRAGQQELLPEALLGAGSLHERKPATCWPRCGAYGDLPPRAAPHAPEVAWTATRRKPFTSPFSLTTATRCTRGTGYSKLLRYTKALGEQRPRSGPSRCGLGAALAAARPGLTTQHGEAERGAKQPGQRAGRAGGGCAGWGEAGGQSVGCAGDRRRHRDRGGGGRARGRQRGSASGAGTGLSPQGHTRCLRAEEGGFSLLQGGGGPGDPATPSYDPHTGNDARSPSASRPFPSDPWPQRPTEGSHGRTELDSFSDPSRNTAGRSSQSQPTGHHSHLCAREVG